MIYEIVMPQLGITMTEGSVLRWLKQAGDAVAKEEPVLEVQTDKVDMEVEAPFDGFLTTILVQEGTTVPVGTPVGLIAQHREEVAEPTRNSASNETLATPNATALPGTSFHNERARGPLASPRARRVASEHGVDLSQISGTGEFGRIRESDIRGYLEKNGASGKFPAPPVRSEDHVRKIIAGRLTQSVTTVPQFWLAREVDASALVALRAQILERVEQRENVRISYTDFLLKSLAFALEQNPEMKQQWIGNGLQPCGTTAIGFAAQTPGKLMVPVIRDAESRGLINIAAERIRLTTLANQGRLLPADLEGACCTLSNLGAFGVDEFQAIINPPESCILATGRIAPRPVSCGDRVVSQPTLRLVLTVDHRVADGVAGARFLSSIADVLENPAMLLI